MRRRTPVFAAVDDQMVSSGLQPDRHTLKRILWETAANVVFWNGTVRRKIPSAPAFNPGVVAPVRGIGQLKASDGASWVWAGLNNQIFRWEFGAPEQITAAFGTYVGDQSSTQRPTQYDFTPYGDWMIVNSGFPAEPAKIYKPGAPATFNQYAAGEAPVGVTRFMKIMSFVMAIGYGPRGTQVGWSDASNIEVYTPSTTNSAGSLSIDEFMTPIRAAAKLGNAIAVYSEDQMALVSYIGSPFYFGQRTTLDGIGCVGKQAVASDTRINVGMSRSGAWWTDGQSSRYIDEGYISNYFQDNINWDQAGKIVVGRNDYTGCFEFHFPMHGSLTINEAWVWDPKTGGWGPTESRSAVDERRLFNYMLLGGNSGAVRFADYDPTGADMEATIPGMTALVLETHPIVMSTAQSPHVVVRMDEVDILAHQANHIEYRVGCIDEPSTNTADWTWTEWADVTQGYPTLQLAGTVDDNQPLPEAPYYKLALRSTPGQTNWSLDLQGFLFYGEVTGTKM